MSNIYSGAEDLNRKVEDTGNKKGTSTLPDITNVNGKWESNVEGDRDVTVIATIIEIIYFSNITFMYQKVPLAANQDSKLMTKFSIT